MPPPKTAMNPDALPPETAEKVVAISDSVLALGAEVRQLRKARRMTQKRLAEIAGISLSHVSAIERGGSNPSMDVLAGIAAGLDVTPDWFFARRPGAGPNERAFVVRAHNRRNLNRLYGEGAETLGYSDSLLSSSIGGGFYMGIAVYEPRSEKPRDRVHTHDGEQHGLVLEGELEIRIGNEVITLGAGDSYSFDARVPHHVRNISNRPCRLVWAVSPVVIPKNVVASDAAARKSRQ